MNNECAKLYTNMAATFYKIHDIASNPRNDLQAALGNCIFWHSIAISLPDSVNHNSHFLQGDTDCKMTWDDSLEESFTMAKKAISCNELWWKGYFYAGDNCMAMG